MFFKKKNAGFTNWLEEKFGKLETGITSQKRQLGEIKENMNQLQSAVQKHDMALEDLLDEWEKRQSEDSLIRERFLECSQNEQRLLELFEIYQEQFWNLKRFASTKDESWAAQIALMEESLRRPLQLCGIDIIHTCNAEVDYDLHEVIKTTDTADPGKAGKIADIYRCGYVYKGNVKKKAQVAAYKLQLSNQ